MSANVRANLSIGYVQYRSLNNTWVNLFQIGKNPMIAEDITIPNKTITSAKSRTTINTGVVVSAGSYNYITGTVSYPHAAGNKLGVMIGATDLGTVASSSSTGNKAYNKSIPAAAAGQVIFYQEGVSQSIGTTGSFSNFKLTNI